MSKLTDLRNSHFYCPITEEVMRDPVVDPEGNSYEREAITSWLQHNTTSPITRTRLTIDQLIPNRSLRKAIEDEQAMVSKSPNISEDIPSAPPAGRAEQSQPIISLSCKEGRVPHTLELLASVSPPSDVTQSRSGCDICCVVDVSGSMGGIASIPGAENSGLSLLDITKHALKTVIASLNDIDRISLVSYSNAANVVCGLTPMTSAGKSRVLGLVDTLEADGMTNLWDGLKKGLDTLTEAGAGSVVRNAAVFLLTDGEPNVEPPRGHIPMLKLYREKHQGRFPGSISTFGFGYSVKSLLLRDIAEVGGGMYAFIPDSGFVGTAFVNALANQLATMSTQVVLSVELPPELQVALPNEDCILGQASCMVTSWGASIDLSTLKYGQSKDVIIRLALPDGVSAEDVMQAADFLASVSYTPLPVLGNSNEPNSTPSQEVISTSRVTATSAESDSFIAVQSFRCDTIVIISDLMQQKLTAPEAPVSTASLTALISDMQQWLRDHPKNRANAYTTLHYELVEGLMKDLSGQVTEAIQGDYFKKWGRHFLPSLARSHQLQECLNFKDPGVQMYGGNLFQSQRDFADDAFNTLPPPTPSVSRTVPVYSNHGRGAGASRSPRNTSRPVSMSCFNSASAPCFHGDCLVHMEDGSRKPVAEIRRGDRVLCNVHQRLHSKFTNQTAEVECVVETQTKTGHLDLVHFEDGLQVTPYHPIFGAQRTCDIATRVPSWHFPVDSSVGKMHETACTAVYSFVLRSAGTSIDYDKSDHVGGGRAESMLINNIPCITLAHGIQNDDVASHAFYGTDRVVQSLRDVDVKSFDDCGHVVLQEGCVLKDPETGLAYGFRNLPNHISDQEE